MSGDSNSQRRFNTKYIEGLKVDIRTDFKVPGEPGLDLRVTPKGSKTWSLLYRRKSDGKKRRVTIGSHEEYGLAAIKVRAAELRVAIAKGADPAGEKIAARKAETVSELLDIYLTDHAKSHKRSWREDERIFCRDVKPTIGHIKARELRRTEALAMLNAIRDRGSPIMANRTLAALRRALNWAVGESLIEHNPCTGIANRGAETIRTRVLSKEEIRSFWTGLDDAPMSGSIKMALKLALVTGQRIGEICAVERDEINLTDAIWSIPEEKSKNGLAHTVPLSSLAIVLFEDAMWDGDTSYLFPSRSQKVPSQIRAMDVSALDKALRRCLPTIGFPIDPDTGKVIYPIRAHDLRRTCATGLAELGIAESTIARVLNHKSEIGKTITGRVYIQHGYGAEKRYALEAWATRLEEITDGQGRTSNVVLIGKGS